MVTASLRDGCVSLGGRVLSAAKLERAPAFRRAARLRRRARRLGAADPTRFHDVLADGCGGASGGAPSVCTLSPASGMEGAADDGRKSSALAVEAFFIRMQQQPRRVLPRFRLAASRKARALRRRRAAAALPRVSAEANIANRVSVSRAACREQCRDAAARGGLDAPRPSRASVRRRGHHYPTISRRRRRCINIRSTANVLET